MAPISTASTLYYLVSALLVVFVSDAIRRFGPRPVVLTGIASLAHPGTTMIDEMVPALVEAGLGALEAYHSSHDAATTDRYVALARRWQLAITGGSDFHGDGMRRADSFGSVSVPREEFERFRRRAQR